ncbi:MAG: efflux RND transporter permease subunit [Phycisphaerales bacterium]|nr:MAG: efflux RND transporter permease subunit [Phycisphaerales bacterium]
MNVAEASIRYKTITLVMTILIIGGGTWSYERLGRLEDPEFTIKNAQIFTNYPGATAMEVAEEVTDEIETAVQQLGQLDLVTSISEPGKSTVLVEMKDKYNKHSLPQVWDELRRKVNDAQSKLPPGAGPSLVYDDFGDVYGVFHAVYGDGYSYAELKDYVDLLRRELLLCEDVGKITVYGDQPEAVYVEISRARLARLGIAPAIIYQTLSGQNLIQPAGKAKVGSQYIRIHPTGEFSSVEDIGDLLILQDDATASKLYLKDVAAIKRGYLDPPSTIMRFNGRPAIGLGISTVLGGNVVTMGEAVKHRLHELKAETPIGMEVGAIAHQADSVTTAVNGFIVSLAEALAIVIGVLMFAMGMRSGVLIGIILLLTVLATLIVMKIQGIMLERISLGALIIALGMLVDNAIVVVEGILVNLQRGMDRVKAAAQIVGQTIWPLLGATIVAVLAFAAIGVSRDSTGEYCRSLFQVILISLMMSWVLAIAVTPLFGVMFLRAKGTENTADPYGGILFRAYRSFVSICIRARWLTVLVMVVLLALSIRGFGFVKRSFFPDSTRPQFMVHYWLPQGTHISRTEEDLKRIEQHLATLDEVTDVSTFVGRGALRFLLTYTPEDANSSYGLLLVSVSDYKKISTLLPLVQDYLAENFPDAQAFPRQFMLGPGDAQKIQVRFRGPAPDVLRSLAAQARSIMLADPDAVDVMDDWRQRVPLIRPVVAETQARDAGITRAEITGALQAAFEGKRIGVYRERDKLLPIIGRSPEEERGDIDNLHDARIWSPVAGRSLPISQVVRGFESQSEDSIVRRRDRLPTLTVKCDPRSGPASILFEKLRPKIEAIEVPTGYSLEWGGEYENSRDAQAALAGKMPIVAMLMVLVVIFLFNSIRLPLIIFLTVPLAIIGVTAGLLLTGQPFGFMALLGFLSLSGMLIKNAIVLIDEINCQIGAGKEALNAVVDSGVSRVRPVSMAALTTVLGMIPLLADAFFVAMAVTIMFGLAFATVLTLVFVPVLYACFFRIPSPVE